MKQNFLFIVPLLIVIGCAPVTGHSSIRTCSKYNSGLVGCYVSAKTKQTKERTRTTKQRSVEDPKHLAKAMDSLRPYCPIDFEDLTATAEDHERSARIVLFIMESNKHFLFHSPEDYEVFKRQMRYNCWALSVYHFGSHSYYPPLKLFNNDVD